MGKYILKGYYYCISTKSVEVPVANGKKLLRYLQGFSIMGVILMSSVDGFASSTVTRRVRKSFVRFRILRELRNKDVDVL